MEMEVHELAKRPERSCHLEHGWKGGPDRALNLCCAGRRSSSTLRLELDLGVGERSSCKPV
jgi:hypothetical protein